jgi:salicylate hydroxylase
MRYRGRPSSLRTSCPFYDQSAEDFKYAFTAYDALRRPRSQELVRRSREQGHQLQLESTLLPAFSDKNRDEWGEQMKTEIELNARWVWNVDLENMLLEAQEMFKRIKGGNRNLETSTADGSHMKEE